VTGTALTRGNSGTSLQATFAVHVSDTAHSIALPHPPRPVRNRIIRPTHQARRFINDGRMSKNPQHTS